MSVILLSRNSGINLSLQGIEGAFNPAFTLRRTGEDDFNPQLLTGPLHLREVAAFRATEYSGHDQHTEF